MRGGDGGRERKEEKARERERVIEAERRRGRERERRTKIASDYAVRPKKRRRVEEENWKARVVGAPGVTTVQQRQPSEALSGKERFFLLSIPLEATVRHISRQPRRNPTRQPDCRGIALYRKATKCGCGYGGVPPLASATNRSENVDPRLPSRRSCSQHSATLRALVRLLGSRTALLSPRYSLTVATNTNNRRLNCVNFRVVGRHRRGNRGRRWASFSRK